MTPVDIVHLYLHEIPVVLVVEGNKLLELAGRAMEREPELADPPGLPLLQQVIDHAVVLVALLEGLVAALPDRVEQVVVEVVRLHLVERVPVHLQRRLRRIVVEVRELRGNVEGLAGIAVQGLGGSLLRLPAQVRRRRVVVVHAMLHGIGHHVVDLLLVYDVLAVLVLYHWPEHAAVANERNLVPVARVGPVFHLPRLLVAFPGSSRRGGLLLSSGAACGSRGNSRGTGYLEKISSVHGHASSDI